MLGKSMASGCMHHPAAGSVKNRRERMVPLHPHLIDQGFVEFARPKKGDTPLFYSLSRQR
jgi:hypothetical protein